MYRPLCVLLLLLVSSLVLAGCTGGGDGLEAPSDRIGGDGLVIHGTIVDEELVPVEGATVSAKDLSIAATTDASGRFRLGPVAPGEYIVTAAKEGYASATLAIVVLEGETVPALTFTLRAVASNVPYHYTRPFVTFVNCASRNPIGGVPCTKLVDYVAGTNLSPQETFAFPFKVTDANLADILIEMVWTQQQLGKDMLFKVQTPPGQPATALSTAYFVMSGGAPLRGWMAAGVKNCPSSNPNCSYAVFNAEPNKVTYEGQTIWSGENATIPGVPGVLSGTSVYINHKTEVFMTFFHNRPGSRAFTALPDR